MKMKRTLKFSDLFVKEDGGDVGVSNASADSATSGLSGNETVKKRNKALVKVFDSLDRQLSDIFGTKKGL